jgi:hypothetical protein
MTTLGYYCDGPVRGHCGHKHRTIEAATRCLVKDIRRCIRVAEHSDRHIYHEDGASLTTSEEQEKATIHRAMMRGY